MRVTKISEGLHVASTDYGTIYLSKDEDGWSIQDLRCRLYGSNPEYRLLKQAFDSLADAIYAL